MDELVLVRHAATSWTGWRYCGRGDPPLSDAGDAAAARLAAELASSLAPGIRIVSSPLLRARQTDFGIAEGLTYEELTRVAPDIAARLAGGDVGIDWPDGEPAASLAVRVEAAWRDLTRHGRRALVVSHGGPLRIAIALATNRELSDVMVPEPGCVWRLPDSS